MRGLLFTDGLHKNVRCSSDANNQLRSACVGQLPTWCSPSHQVLSACTVHHLPFVSGALDYEFDFLGEPLFAEHE
jgi:hypothetical protein